MNDAANTHQPVLLAEAIEALNIDPNGKYIDCTFGRGGHSQEILNKLNTQGRLLAIDQDAQAIEYGKKKFSDESRIILMQSNFSNITQVAKQHNFDSDVQGILFDLGVSSPQLDNAERGFSFMHDGPLDMRMNTSQGVSASEWLQRVDATDLARILKEFGQERFSKRIANAIVEHREEIPIKTTKQLADLVMKVIGQSREQKHPATRTFQAIRLYINKELESLAEALEACLSLLANSGRLITITFHSLEDQIVKNLLQTYSHSNLPRKLPVTDERKQKLNRICKPIKPSDNEIANNPRSRSAKLHVLEWIAC